MAVAFDAVGPSSAGQTATGAGGVTWTHTAVASGVALLIGFGYGHASGTDGTLTVLVDGSPATFLGKGQNDVAGATLLYGIANLTSGAHTVAVTVSGGAASQTWEAGSVSYAGADTSSPFGTAVTANGSSTAPSVAVTGTLSTSMVGGVASIGTNTITNPASSRWTANFSNSNGAGNAGQADKAGGGTVTLTWSGTASDDWGAVAVEVLAPRVLTVTTTSLPAAASGTAYSQALQASGGTAPYNWAVTSGALPSWASLNSSTGAITGTPPSGIGGSSFTVQVTDNVGATASQALTIGVQLTVSLVGSAGTAGSTSGSVTGSYGQSPTAGSLLLAAVTAGSTTVKTPNISTGTAGWSRLGTGTIGNNPSGTSAAECDIWVKTAAGSDAQPVFTQTLAGTAGMGCWIYELASVSLADPLDVSGVYQSGNATSTVTFALASSAPVGGYGEFAISVMVQERASATLTWTETGTGWTSQGKLPASGASVVFSQSNSQAAPTPAGVLSDGGHWSTQGTARGAGILAVIQGAPVVTAATRPLIVMQAVNRAGTY